MAGKCEIVHFDWIVDCLLGKRFQKRLLVAKTYTLERALKRLKKSKKDIEEHRAKFEDGVKASKDLCNNGRSFHS